MGKSRFKMALFGVAVLMVMLLSACGNTTTTNSNSSAPKFQVGLVADTAGLSDRGFNQLAHTGYENAEAKYHFKDSVVVAASSSDYVNKLTQEAQSNDLVIGVGFDMAQAIDQVAKQFPQKKFALVDSCAQKPDFSCEDLPNVTPLLFREEQAGCLVGVVAGKMEMDGKAEVPHLLGANTIGAVGGQEIPPVDHYIAGYKYCAQQVDPTVKVIVQFSNDFGDPTKCQAPADAMIKQKQADIIFQVAGGCGLGALSAAATDGVYGIGVDTDQGYNHPDSIVTSAVKHVETAVFSIIDLTEQGKYPSNPSSFPAYDLNNGGVGVAPFNSAVPSDVQPLVDQYVSQIKSGTLQVPNSCAPAQSCASS